VAATIPTLLCLLTLRLAPAAMLQDLSVGFTVDQGAVSLGFGQTGAARPHRRCAAGWTRRWSPADCPTEWFDVIVHRQHVTPAAAP